MSLHQILEKIEQAGQEKNAPTKHIPAGSRVKVTFSDGQIVEGKLVEQTRDYVRVDSVGLAMTYFTDVIWRIEETGSDDAKSP